MSVDWLHDMTEGSVFEPILLKPGTDPGVDVKSSETTSRKLAGDATHRFFLESGFKPALCLVATRRGVEQPGSSSGS